MFLVFILNVYQDEIKKPGYIKFFKIYYYHK